MLTKEAVTTDSPLREQPDDLSVWTRFQPGLLRIAFQPIVSLLRGQAFGHEALARPMTAAGEPIRPDELFRWALASGEADALDRFVLERILSDLAARPQRDTPVFVNVLPISLPLVTDWLLSQTYMPPRLLVLELLEETASGPDLGRWLSRLRRHGYRIAVDDVGAGYSSLTRLVEVRPDFAKIDLGLVRHIDVDPVKFSLVEATARFAHMNGIQLIAEGVETPAELGTLRELGIELAQGFLLGRPGWELYPEPAIALPPLTMRSSQPPEVLVSSLVRLLRFAARGMRRGEGAAEALVTVAAQASGADMVALLQREQGPAGVEWRWLASQGIVRPEALPAEDLDLGEQLFASMRPIVMQHVPPRTQWHSQSLLALPIAAGGQPWGALVIAYREPDRVRPPVVEMLTGLAALVGMLTDANALPPSATEVSGEGLLMAARALVPAPGAPSEPEGDSLVASLQHVLMAALSLTGGHTGFIGYTDPARERLYCVDTDKEPFPLELASFRDPSTADGISCNGEAIRLLDLSVSDDVRTDPRMLPWREELLADGILSAAAVPLVAHGELLGLLKVYHGTEGALSDPSRRSRLEGLAALAAALIERTEGDSRARVAEHRQTVVLDGQHHLVEADSAERVVEVLLDTVHQLLPHSLAAVVEPGPNQLFRVRRAVGEATAYFDHWRVSADPDDPDGRLPVSEAYRTGQTHWIRPGWPGSWPYRDNPRRPPWDMFGFRWLLAVPLRARRQSLMVLAIYGSTDDLDAEIRRLIEDLARTAGLALVNALPQADSPELKRRASRRG